MLMARYVFRFYCDFIIIVAILIAAVGGIADRYHVSLVFLNALPLI